VKFDVYITDGSKAILVAANADFRGYPRIGDIVQFRDKGTYMITGRVVWEQQEDGEFKGTFTVTNLNG
jgi:hypothetical protein